MEFLAGWQWYDGSGGESEDGSGIMAMVADEDQSPGGGRGQKPGSLPVDASPIWYQSIVHNLSLSF